MKITVSNIQQKILLVIYYIMVLSYSGFYFHELGGFNIVVRVVCLLGLLYLADCRIRKDVFVVLCLQLGVFGLSSIIAGDSFITIIVILIDFLSAFLLASYYKINELLETYRKFIYYICFFSTILFLVSTISIQVFSFLPTFTHGNHETYFAVVSFIYKPRQYFSVRNTGLFWEPGAFQIYIVIAFLLDLLRCEKPNLKRLIVYSITILTTFSTTGILCLGLLWFVYAFNQHTVNKRVACISLLSAAFFVFILNAGSFSADFNFAIFEKVAAFFDSSSTLFTANVRQSSIIYPLKAFLSSPLIGVGKVGMNAWAEEVGHTMNTCTPINWFAHYGIFMGGSIVVGYYFLIKQFTQKRFVVFLSLMVFLFSVCTEAINYNPTVFFFCYVGYLYAFSNFKGKNTVSV